MSLPRSTSPKTRKSSVALARPSKTVRDDPTSLIIDYDAPPETRKPRGPNEFIVSCGAHCIEFHSGMNIDLDSVIGTEEEVYREGVKTFHDEQSRGLWKPTETFADMVDDKEAPYGDLVIWEAQGRVLAVLVPRLDETGYDVTRFSKDRATSGPISPPRKVIPAPVETVLPVAPKDGNCYVAVTPTKPGPWRVLQLCYRGEMESIYMGYGLTVEDITAEMARNLRDDDPDGEPRRPCPEDYPVFEGPTHVATVRSVGDGTGQTELVWVQQPEPTTAAQETVTIPAPAGARVVSIVGCEATINDLFLDLREIRRYANDDEKPYSDEDQHIYENGQYVAILRTIPEEDRDSEGNLRLIMVEAGKRAPRKPTKPWRSFKVDRPGGGCATIVEGHGTTLDDAIAEAVEQIDLMSSSGLEPSDHVIIEQDRVICRVLVRDVQSEATWNEACDEEYEDQHVPMRRADVEEQVVVDAPAAAGTIPTGTPSPAPFSPANLPELILTLARVELRDAVDALLGARFRVNQAHSGMQRLDGDAKRMAKALDERADNVCTEAEFAITKSLLSVWGIDDGEVHPADEAPVPWTPCGALVDGRYFVWVVPNEHHGRPDYSIYREVPRVRVIDNEDLEEDGLSDDDWERLLERPPCRYVVLSGSKPAVVVDPECMTWR